jgi:membrane protease YdiL (CAAX protease family)
MPVVYVTLGIIALLAGDPRLSADARLTGIAPDRWWSLGSQIGLGIGVGLALFVATRLFVAAIGRWERFVSDTRVQYAQRTGTAVWLTVLAALAALVGEEVFWRGLVQSSLAEVASGLWAGPVWGAVLAWGFALVANLASRSLPVIAGSVVAGGIWAGLPLLTGGIAASLCCHAVWTSLMLVLPPRAGRAMMTR